MNKSEIKHSNRFGNILVLPEMGCYYRVNQDGKLLVANISIEAEDTEEDDWSEVSDFYVCAVESVNESFGTNFRPNVVYPDDLSVPRMKRWIKSILSDYRDAIIKGSHPILRSEDTFDEDGDSELSTCLDELYFPSNNGDSVDVWTYITESDEVTDYPLDFDFQEVIYACRPIYADERDALVSWLNGMIEDVTDEKAAGFLKVYRSKTWQHNVP